jgi:hypothetical protein
MVIFIPKPGRDSYELAQSFRPISLTSFFLKTMERLVDSYIRAGLLKSFPLMESQYTYHRDRSTEAAFHDLVQKIVRSWNQKEFALGVFLDIDGAFDNASFGSINAASGGHGVVLTLRKLIDAMLRCRSVRVEIRGSNIRVLVNRGCPQGGVLSPILWNMVVDYLLRRIHNTHYQAQGYADDVALLQKSKLLSTLCDRMQGALNWCREIGLSVNADKTKLVLFTNNKMVGVFYNPRLFGAELRMTDQVKYQGRSWIGSLIGRRSLHCILAVRSCCGKDLGIITWLYTSVVRSILSYALLV